MEPLECACTATARLVPLADQSASAGCIRWTTRLVADRVRLEVDLLACDPGHAPRLILPLIARRGEPWAVSAEGLRLRRRGGELVLRCPRPAVAGPRVFNHVPGLSALPLSWELVVGQRLDLELEVA